MQKAIALIAPRSYTKRSRRRAADLGPGRLRVPRDPPAVGPVAPSQHLLWPLPAIIGWGKSSPETIDLTIIPFRGAKFSLQQKAALNSTSETAATIWSLGMKAPMPKKTAMQTLRDGSTFQRMCRIHAFAHKLATSSLSLLKLLVFSQRSRKSSPLFKHSHGKNHRVALSKAPSRWLLGHHILSGVG